MTGASHDWTPTELAALLAAEREGGPFLLLRDGDGQQRLLELTGERLTVGREEGSDLALTWDAEVSRLHALLEHLGELDRRR